jgi:NADH:ubiquinone oxidoreductase subunit 6 (subunit J)
VLLKGTIPAAISSAPLVILIYVVLLLLLGCAIASVLLRNLLYAVGAFAATMLLAAILYLTIAPALLFAVQLLIFTGVSALLLAGLLRSTTGLEGAAVGPFSREWIVGAAVAAVGLALVGVVVAATSWPVHVCCSAIEGFGSSLTNPYVVGLATVVVLLASAALGAGLILRTSPTLPFPRGGGKTGLGGESLKRRSR